jgi:hypothetical protein
MYSMVTAQFANSSMYFKMPKRSVTGQFHTFTPGKQDSSTCWIKDLMDPRTGLDTVAERVTYCVLCK